MNAAGWIVAGYAAIVSTASLVWQVTSWKLARKNRVEVSVAAALIGLTDGGMTDALAINLVNHSDHAVRVTGVGIDLQDGSGRQAHLVREPPGATIPGTVAPHDSGSTYFLTEELEESGVDIFGPIAGWVRLATGETMKSKPRVTRSRD